MEKRFREESTAAAEAPKTSGKTEDECSESFQTGVAEGEKHPNLLRDTLCARNKIRTAPLWGLRLRSRLMHDGQSVQLDDAIRRHKGESAHVTERFLKLQPSDQKALLPFCDRCKGNARHTRRRWPHHAEGRSGAGCALVNGALEESYPLADL